MSMLLKEARWKSCGGLLWALLTNTPFATLPVDLGRWLEGGGQERARKRERERERERETERERESSSSDDFIGVETRQASIEVCRRGEEGADIGFVCGLMSKKHCKCAGLLCLLCWEVVNVYEMDVFRACGIRCCLMLGRGRRETERSRQEKGRGRVSMALIT
jgi:hypothetical protein